MGGGSDDGGYNPAMFQQASPIPGVPVAGSGKSSAGGDSSDPYNYGKYQSFLPGPGGGSAYGLTDDMFKYRTPNEILNPGSTPAETPATPAATPPTPLGARGWAGSATGSPYGQDLRNYFAQFYNKIHGGQPAPTPTPTPPPTTPTTTAETPEWMNFSMTG